MGSETEIQRVSFGAKNLASGLYLAIEPVDGKTITPLKGVLGFFLREGVSAEKAKALEAMMCECVESLAFTKG